MYAVLHTESSEGWGGQENRTLHESMGLRKLGVRAVILCQPGSVLGKRAEAEGFEVRTCRMKKSYDLSAIGFILNVIQSDGIDVISTHSGRDSFLAGAAGRLSRRRPIIVRTRHLAMPITSRISYSLLPHRVITVSEYVRRYLVREGISPEKVVTIPTGIDTGRFSPEDTRGGLRQELGVGPEVPLVGTIGILRIKKGHHILLDAIPAVIKEIPGVLFVFAGDGPQKRNILKKIEELGLQKKVHMLGLRRDIPDILKSLDLFVLPTLQEALGTSFIEAMAMKKPVIGTAVGGVSEVVEDGRNGYLVEPDDPSALARSIIAMLKDRERATIMGEEGRKIVLEHFTMERMCERVHALYLSLIREKNR